MWERFKANDYIAFSCDCNDGPSANLWADTTVDRLPQDDQAAVVLKSGWCEKCGPEFCDAIRAGETQRGIPAHVRGAIQKMRMQEALAAKRERNAQQRSALRGLR